MDNSYTVHTLPSVLTWFIQKNINAAEIKERSLNKLIYCLPFSILEKIMEAFKLKALKNVTKIPGNHTDVSFENLVFRSRSQIEISHEPWRFVQQLIQILMDKCMSKTLELLRKPKNLSWKFQNCLKIFQNYTYIVNTVKQWGSCADNVKIFSWV